MKGNERENIAMKKNRIKLVAVSIWEMQKRMQVLEKYQNLGKS